MPESEKQAEESTIPGADIPEPAAETEVIAEEVMKELEDEQEELRRRESNIEKDRG